MGNGQLEHRQDFWARLIAATFVMRAAIAAVSLALCWILHVIPAAERPAEARALLEYVAGRWRVRCD